MMDDYPDTKMMQLGEIKLYWGEIHPMELDKTDMPMKDNDMEKRRNWTYAS